MPEAIAPRSGWTGLMLAGGRSARMGTEKGRLPRDPQDQTDLFTGVAKQLLACCTAMCILGGDRTFEEHGQSWAPIADQQAHSGPLTAILDSASDWPTPWAMILPLDMPALPTTLLAAGQAAAERARGQGHPGQYAVNQDARGCFPLWLHRDVLAPLQKFRQEGRRSLFAGLIRVDALGWNPAGDFLAPGGDPFRNLNTPADLQAWHDCLSEQQA